MTKKIDRGERSQKASDLRPLIGQKVDITWGVGSQQFKQTASGKLLEVGETSIVLTSKVYKTIRIPLSFLIRYQQ